ncbi:hypothetical protein ACFQ1L_33750 [Phytohabitans flavus]|uniref:hypothetical protein n=1 Tax=Phytohabitans flavus TaxID=1076124 RepID=UPI00362DC5AF
MLTAAVASLGACSGGDDGGQAAAPTPTPGSLATSSPPASSPPANGAGGGEGAILRGERQVAIAPAGTPDSLLTLDGTDRLVLAKGSTDRGLFILTPAGGRFQIKTANVGANGATSCLRVKENGVNPLTIVAAACNTADQEQLFTVEASMGKPAGGLPTYTIGGSGGVYLVDSAEGLIAQEIGDADGSNTFSFVDRGPSTPA